MDDGAGLTRPGPPCGPMDLLCFPHPRSSALRWSSGRRLPAIVSDLHWGRSLNPGPDDQSLPVHPGAWSPAGCLPVGLCLLWVHLAVTTRLKPSKGSSLSSTFYTVCVFPSDFGRNLSTQGPGERWPWAHISARALGPRLFLFLFCLEFLLTSGQRLSTYLSGNGERPLDPSPVARRPCLILLTPLSPGR